MKKRTIKLIAMGILTAAIMTNTLSSAVFASELPARIETQQTEVSPETEEAVPIETENDAEESAASEEEAAPVSETSEAENEQIAENTAAETEETEIEETGEETAAETEETAEEVSEESVLAPAEETIDDESLESIDEETASAAFLVSAGTTAGESQKTQDTVNKEYVNILNAIIDTFAYKFPGGRIIGAPLKSVISRIYGQSASVSNAQLLGHLEDIEEQLSELKRTSGETVKNTVVLGNYGRSLDELYSYTEALMTDIEDIRLNDSLTADEQIQQIASLYNGTKVSELTTSLNLVSKMLSGETMQEIDARDLFQVVFDNMKYDMMFSGEVIDATTPYLQEAMRRYSLAYLTLDEVITARESVEGPRCALSTRKKMVTNFTGSVNEDGSLQKSGIMQSFTNYFNQNRFTFINKGKGEPVKLNGTIVAKAFENSYSKDDSRTATAFVKSQKLNKEQVQSLADYAASKNMTLVDFLRDIAGFNFSPMTDNEKRSSGYIANIESLQQQADIIREEIAAIEAEISEIKKEIKSAGGNSTKELDLAMRDVNKRHSEKEDQLREVEAALAELINTDSVDFDKLCAGKTCYLLAGNLIDDEVRYAGFSHSRHSYREYFIDGVNVNWKGAGVGTVAFGTTEGNYRLYSMALLIFQSL